MKSIQANKQSEKKKKFGKWAVISLASTANKSKIYKGDFSILRTFRKKLIWPASAREIILEFAQFYTFFINT